MARSYRNKAARFADSPSRRGTAAERDEFLSPCIPFAMTCTCPMTWRLPGRVVRELPVSRNRRNSRVDFIWFCFDFGNTCLSWQCDWLSASAGGGWWGGGGRGTAATRIYLKLLAAAELGSEVSELSAMFVSCLEPNKRVRCLSLLLCAVEVR